MEATIEAWFDGACDPNPGGHAGYGMRIKQNGKQIAAEAVYLGHGPKMTNNVAEYAGVISALKHVANMDDKISPVVIYGDSNLVIQQLSGKWKIKGGIYAELARTAKQLTNELRQARSITFQWIPRERNQECDDLSKAALEMLQAS